MQDLTAPADWRFCVAPMMDWTDRFCRAFHRRLTRRARLYTEMITTGALLHGDRARFLRFDAAEHPVALQLGGSDPDALARCTEYGVEAGYDEINLNCGCPSDRVQVGQFGACLMLNPALVARCIAAMRAVSSVPVTVKCRIGVDDSEDYAFLRVFVETIAETGCDTFIVHARKAWLSGLSPRENREIPPLSYDTVYRLKQDFPQLRIVLNGGLKTLDDCREPLRLLDGVMLGRAPYEDPWLLASVDPEIYGQPAPVEEREDALYALREFIEAELAAGTSLAAATRHILGLFRGEPGGRAYRRVLSEQAHKRGAGWSVVEKALAQLDAADGRDEAA